MALSYRGAGSTREVTIDSDAYAVLRERASAVVPTVPPHHQILLGTLVAADFERGEGRLRDDVADVSVDVVFERGLAAEVKRALLEQSQVEGARTGRELAVQPISQPALLPDPAAAGDFWRPRSLTELAAEPGAELSAYSAEDYLDSELTDEKRDAFVAAVEALDG